MYLRDHPVLNLLRRVRGWRPGRLRVMVEAKEAGRHLFCVYECRGETREMAMAHLARALKDEALELVEVAEELPATVPFPRERAVVRLSDRLYFGDSTAQPARVE